MQQTEILITSYHVSRIIFIERESSVDEDGSHFDAIAADGSDDDGEDEEGKGETADQLPLHIHIWEQVGATNFQLKSMLDWI